MDNRIWKRAQEQHLTISILIGVQLVLFAPTLSWYLARIGDGSDEPLGVVALVAMVLLAWMHGDNRAHRDGTTKLVPLTVPILLTAGHALIGVTLTPTTSFTVPPIVRAAIAALSVATLISARRFHTRIHPGICTLALLSLPIVSSLQFYAGFPLRYATGQVVAFVLRSAGLPVAAHGTLLTYDTQSVWIDAPCSGIKALWCSLFLLAVLITLKPLSRRHTWMMWSVTSTAVFLGNCWRNAALFLIEVTQSIPHVLKPQLHSLIGVSVVLGVGVLIFMVWRALPACTSQMVPHTREKPAARVEHYPFLSAPLVTGAVVGCVVTIAVWQLVRQSGPDQEPTLIAPSHPIKAEPELLQAPGYVEVALTPRERRWAEGFPGTIRRFTRRSEGTEFNEDLSPPSEVVVRHITTPTRKLHPIADCLRGAGYTVEPLPAQTDAEGVLRGCVRTSQNGIALRVCEHIIDRDGGSFPDISAWYWAASLGRTNGPWRAVVEMTGEVKAVGG